MRFYSKMSGRWSAKIGAIGLIGLVVFLGNAVASAGIRDDAEVFDRLLKTAIASEIRDNCDTISARKFTATIYVLGIVSYAMRQGYSKADIDEFRFDPIQQDRMRVATYAYLDENGVDREDPASYCVLGLAEIKNKTQSGKLLKSR